MNLRPTEIGDTEVPMDKTPPPSRHPRVRHAGLAAGATRGLLAACAALLGVAPALAQYAYDPSNPDEQGPGIRYFGSAKDEKGSLLQGVTVLIDSDETAYVFVTDDQGRFRGKVPLNMVAGKITAECSKPGFQVVRVTKRAGPTAPNPTVQVDCVLRAASAG